MLKLQTRFDLMTHGGRERMNNVDGPANPYVVTIAKQQNNGQKSLICL